MAIVKFISDLDCHIFIDKENVGKVTVDSLLKVVLEIGGYLIEVKDDEGRILKKYNLEIKPTDNKVLQDVSRAVRKANKWAIVNCNNGNVNVKDLLFIYESVDELDRVRRGLIVNMPVTSPKSPIKRIRF